nr:PREDICTED: protein N-lysine methyltransferase METTL21A-like isoform X2 [Bemisia tabaci]
MLLTTASYSRPTRFCRDMFDRRFSVVTISLLTLTFLEKSTQTKYIDGVNINLDAWRRLHHMNSLNKTLIFQQYNNLNLGDISWESAQELATYLEVSSKNNSLLGKRVIELGAGLGCVGIAAACLGNEDQIEGTGGRARAQVLTWGDSEDLRSLPKQDVILMSNIISNEQSVHPLISTLVSLSHEETTLLICQESFFEPELSAYWRLFHKYASKLFTFTELPCVNSIGLMMEKGVLLSNP